MFDETISGDISNDPNSPLAFALSEGSNTLSATSGNGDQEYVTVTVPEGFELASLTLDAYDGLDRVAFIGVQEGSTFTEPLDNSADRSNLLGYLSFGSVAEVGTDILDDIGSGADAVGFDGPLPAGTYTFALQQLGDPATYTLDFNLAAATTESPEQPPTGEAPVVSFETVPATFSEEDPNNLVEWRWNVAGDFPEDGITINLDTSGGEGAFAFTNQFANDPPAEFINSEIVDSDPETGRINILLSEPEASFKLYFIDDILEEGTQEFNFQLADGEGYTVDPDTNGGLFTITDDNGGPGVGPTIGLTTSETELAEGDTFTVTFTADGEIPAEGVQVLVQSDVPGSLGQFDIADLGNITTTGIEGLPTVGDGGGGSFFITMTEPTATITLDIFDDIVAEEPLPVTFTVANGEEYEVDAANPGFTLNITDEPQPAGPTVGLTVDKTDVTEGETITLTFAVEGEIPDGGVRVLVNDVASAQGQLRSLTEFDVANIETTGIEGLPEGADGDSGFFVTITEPTATLTVPVFDEGADEDEANEVFTFALIDGEAYEVDDAASSFTLNISDPTDGGGNPEPPTGDLPVLSFTATPTALNEEEGTALVFDFSVEGDFPEDGIVVRFNENFFDTGDQIDFNVFELENLEFFDFEETSPGLFTVDYLLSAPQGSLTTAVFDDNVAEGEFIYEPALLPIPDANYTINPDASSASISVIDGVPGTGGPVVNLSVDQTDVTEGDTVTVTLTAEGEILEGGLEINVDTGVDAGLGDFISTDEGGIPNITATGFSGAPAPNGSASGFSAVMTENTATISFEVVNDGFAEETENFDITLLDGENYDVSGEAVPFSITDANSAVPVVSLEVSPDEISEAEDGPTATLTFTVDGEIPAVEFDADGNYVSGGLPIEFNGSDVIDLLDQITGGPIPDGVEVTRFPADEADTTYEFTLLQNTATITVDILDDVIQEEPQEFSFNIIPSSDGPYAVDPDAFAGSFTLSDGIGGPGEGPTVGISVTETELSEGDSFTVNFTVDGEIPPEGVQVLVDSPTLGALGEFNIFDEEGNPAVEFEGIAAFPTVGDGGGSSFIATITEPEASLTLSVFEDGPTEGLETLEFSLVDGETYEVDPAASSFALNINDGGEDAVFEAESGVTSVFLDFPLLEEAAGLTLVGTDSDATPFSDDFQVGFAIADETDFSFTPAPFTPVGGTIEHDGTITVGLDGAEATIGEFSIGFDPSRISNVASGFFIADTLDDPLGLEILFDIGTPSTLNVGSNELEISNADLLLTQEFATALGIATFTGADVGDARVDALLDLMGGGDMPTVGTEDSDTLVGDDADNSLDGLAGNDILAGGLGNDIILGGDGDDVLRGDLNDRNPQDDSAGGNDIIFGGEGNDRIGGKAGNDILSGDAGDDFIWGDDGDDILMGVTGNDTLVGDNGSNGGGSDLFVFGNGDGTDTIVDFEVGTDRIGLVEGELTFADLTITQDGSNTLLGVTSSGATLAVLNRVQANSLTESSFEVVADVSNPEEALALI